MAKQTGPIIWEKTFNIVCFYKRGDRGYVRMKSNLTGERWRSDPAFEGSRQSAVNMGLASQLASPFYQSIPRHQRSYPHYHQLVGIAQHMLCAGYSILQVNQVLHFTICRYLRKLQAADPARKPVRSPFAATCSLNTKPAFTPAIPQWTIPGFITTTVSNGIRQWSSVVTPRGRPSPVTGRVSIKQEAIPAIAHTSGTPPETKPFLQWQGLLCPYPPNQLPYRQNSSLNCP